MEFIRKFNKTQIVTGTRYEMVEFEEEQTHEVFVIELSRQDVETLYRVAANADMRLSLSKSNYNFIDKLRKELY